MTPGFAVSDNDQIPPSDLPPGGPTDPSDIRPISLTDEMKRSYLDYAMSVIVSRALPDARDGLKPVHRRILYSMHENGYTPDKPYRKSARIVGDVIGKYHPHGDQSIYDALARMAQDFSLRLMLIDGQGNFGSVDGDPPAAMRYTEVKLAKSAMALLEDINEDTVDFQENYDNTEEEPTVLPARFPNLLVNGAGGIAVGMATNIPPHNLGEIIDGTLALIDNPALGFDELMQIIPGPDFPTGALILGRGGIRSAYQTGRGSVIMRARATIEQLRKDREAIIITEIPYQVNKANLLERIAELVREKKVEGISDMRDESDRDGMRIVIELKRDAVGDVVLNQLYRFTSLQNSFGCNFVALNGGRPEVMNLKDLLQAFIDFREVVVSRRTKFRLAKARGRAHELVGLAIAVANIDEVIRLIRSSADAASAREALMTRDWPAQDVAPLLALIDDPIWRIKEDGTYRMSELQARAILDLRLQRLTALGRDEIGAELQKIADQIKDFLDILSSRLRIQTIIREELAAAREAFATPRKTEITDSDADMDDEDLIQREDMVVTVSHAGYVKRVPLSMYRAQRRGGKGRSGMSTKDEDFVTRLFVANTHTMMLFFSSMGQVYKMKVWRLPEAAPTARGKALVNMLPLDPGERITTILPLPDDEALWEAQDIVFATSTGGIRRNKLSDCVPRTSLGKRVMEFEDATQTIIDVQLASEQDDVLLTTAQGQCIRFAVEDVRVFGGNGSTGTSTGNRGILLSAQDKVISMAILRHYEANSDIRTAYLKRRRAETGDIESVVDEAEEVAADATISNEQFEVMQQIEQTVLTLSENGYGKRTSSFEYRITGRGGKGITAMTVNSRNGNLIASFPVDAADQIMLVTDGGQLIRCPVSGIRIAGRSTQGVIVFDTHETEKVVSVERISEPEEEEGGEDIEGAEGA
jgi:DNA gyrase subunit A